MVRARPLDEIEALLRRVQEIAFKAIDDLKHKLDASLFGDVRGLGDRGDAMLSPSVGRHLGVFAMRRIENAAKPDAANVANRFDGVGQQVLAGRGHLGIVAGNIGRHGKAHRDDDGEIGRLRPFREPIEIKLLRTQIGEFDNAVPAFRRLLHCLFKALLGPAVGPNKRMDA